MHDNRVRGIDRVKELLQLGDIVTNGGTVGGAIGASGLPRQRLPGLGATASREVSSLVRGFSFLGRKIGAKR